MKIVLLKISDYMEVKVLGYGKIPRSARGNFTYLYHLKLGKKSDQA